MAHPQAIEVLVRRVARQVKLRRAEYWGLRGAFWGALLAAAVLAFKAAVGLTAFVVAPALADRVATVLEWADHPERTPLVDALLADTVARVDAVESRQIVARVVPREGHWLPLTLLAGLVLALAPAIRLPTGTIPDFTPSTEQEQQEERTASEMTDERSRPRSADPLKRSSSEERDFAQRAGKGTGSSAGDLSAIFKDTTLSSQRPDFNSFLKKGDERLRLLEQVDRLPDLQSDFTNTQYKMVFRKSKSLMSGLSPDISPQKLRELLDEMERLGRKGGNWSGDAAEGMEALEGGQTDRAIEAMQRALDKMRAMEEAGRSGKNLRGGRETARGARGRDRARGGEGAGPEDQDFGEGEGLLPGKGRSVTPKGDPTARLSASPYDVGVEGESRRGKKEGYDTNLTGRAGPMPSRLMYLGVVGQYRKMMEDAITREQVPRDYHDQIRNYFQALDER